MLKKPNPKTAVVDVPADNPEGTLDRFTDGLRRVMDATKMPQSKHKPRRKRRRS